MSNIEREIRRRLWALDDDAPRRRLRGNKAEDAARECGAAPQSIPLTDEFVKDLAPQGREVVVYDSTVECLFLRMRSKGAKSFYCTNERSGPRKLLIGSAMDLSVDQARLQALDHWEGLRLIGASRFRLSKTATVDEAYRAYCQKVVSKRSANHAGRVRRLLALFVDAYRDHRIAKMNRAILVSFVAKVASANCGESRAFIETRIRTTAGQAGISGGDLRAMPVPICSPEEQSQINRILEAQLSQISRLEADVEAGLQKIDALRQSVLKSAFCGKLVPQHPRDEPASVLLERIKSKRGGNASGRRKKSPNAEEAA